MRMDDNGNSNIGKLCCYAQDGALQYSFSVRREREAEFLAKLFHDACPKGRAELDRRWIEILLRNRQVKTKFHRADNTLACVVLFSDAHVASEFADMWTHSRKGRHANIENPTH
jgi:hypothetical protein